MGPRLLLSPGPLRLLWAIPQYGQVVECTNINRIYSLLTGYLTKLD